MQNKIEISEFLWKVVEEGLIKTNVYEHSRVGIS
jgi:hypothetical protein